MDSKLSERVIENLLDQVCGVSYPTLITNRQSYVPVLGSLSFQLEENTGGSNSVDNSTQPVAAFNEVGDD